MKRFELKMYDGRDRNLKDADIFKSMVFIKSFTIY